MIGLAVIVVVLLVAIFGFKFPFALYGSTPLSISGPINYNVNGQPTQLINIYGVAGIGANQLNIQWSPSYISQFLPSGVGASQSVTGQITMSNEIKSFPIIINTNSPFYNIADWRTTFLGYNCPSPPNPGEYLVTQSNLVVSSYCFYGYPQGTDSYFSGTALQSFDLYAEIGSMKGTLHQSAISPTNYLTLSDGVSTLRWTGSLNNYYSLGTPSSYHVLFQNSRFSKLIDSNAYSNYKSSLSNIVGTCSANNINTCISNFNSNLYQNVLRDQTFAYITQTAGVGSANFTTSSGSSGYLNVLLDIPSELPTFQLTLPASSVGITPLIGKPKILNCIQGFSVGSGQTSIKNVNVENTGNSPGQFIASLSCSNGATGVSSQQLVSPSQSVNMPITITSVSTQQGTTSQSCIVTITDSNSMNKDTCNFNLQTSYISSYVCTPNEVLCINNFKTLATCNSQGSGYISTIDCPYGCQAIAGGGAECLKVPESCTSDLDCSNGKVCDQGTGKCVSENQCGFLGLGCLFKNISDFFATIRIIITIVASIAMLIFLTQELKNRVEYLEERPALLWVFSIILSFLFALLVWRIFWVGVIALVLIVLYKSLVGGKIEMGVKAFKKAKSSIKRLRK